jgi:phage terminase large subunit-like protein
MTLLTESLCGSRTPTRLKQPAGELDYRLADDVLSWVDSIGMTLFAWQRDVLRRGLAVNGTKWAAYEVDLVVPRQNGKNELLVALELAAVAVLRKRLVVHSAHEASTAAKHFSRFQELAERLPEVERLLPATKTQGFYTANGKEHIKFRNGATIDFRTRTRKAGRGFSADLVVLDEAFELPPKAVGSLMYTLRARKNPQVWKTSSAAHATSVVLHADRRRADADDSDDSRFLYMEWGNEPDCDPADPASWARSNPSMGHDAPGFALELQTFRNEYASARHDPELLAEFVREVCGVPELNDDSVRPISVDAWLELTDADSLPTDASVRLALDAPPDRRSATFAIAGKRHDNLLHVGIRGHLRPTQPGDASLKDRVIDMAVLLTQGHSTPLILPPSSPARAWKADLVAAGVELDEMTPAEYAEACGRITNAIDDGALRHRGQPDMNAAVGGLAVRTSGDVDAWSRRTSTSNIAPFVAATCALVRVPTTAPSRGLFLAVT